MTVGIYKITNLINGKSYIGQSVRIEKRWQEHQRHPFLKSSNDFFYPLYQSIRKYGLENFKFEIIEKCSKDLLDERERYWIAYYHTWIGDPECNGYNMTDGGVQGKLAEPEFLDDLYQMLREGYSYQKIGEKYHITNQHVGDINLGISWKRENESYPIDKRKRGSKRKPSTLKSFNSDTSSFYCIECGKKIAPQSLRCRSCNKDIISLNLRAHYSRLQKENIIIPDKNSLLVDMYELKSMIKVAEKYSCSTMLIQKWCREFGIETKNKHKLENQYKKEILGEEIVEKPKKKFNQRIIQLDINTLKPIQTFNCIYDAANALGVNHECIRKGVAEGTRAAGYRWRYE